MPSIETTGLTKEFGDGVVAVDNLDLTVEEGEIFGFLGPNGAGKSTTINMLLDYIRPTSGAATVLGMDAQSRAATIRRKVGVLPESYGFGHPLTGREYVEWAIGTKAADDDPERLLDTVGLGDEADRLAKGYSKGMRQRLAFAMALVGDPELLILDEPSTGLDPNGIQTMREHVRDHAENGTTVFFSSHILSEVDAVCDRVGVMNEGRLVAVDTLDALRANATGQATIELECANSPVDVDVTYLDGVADASVRDRTLVVECTDPGVKADVVAHVADQVDVRDVLMETVSLESLFNDLTGGGRDGGDAGGGEVAQ